ncbi:MAG: hypothetical protein NTZ02_04485, partial [Candidatus Woesearchaeota archaeon]|nr:hypothetical protein [Candidatus Woesearchaeota archaeon]
MEEKVIVEIILILLSAGVIAYVILGPGSGIASSSDREVCRASVVAKWATTHIMADSIFQLNCKSHITSITAASLPKSQADAENQIKKQIANEMYDCWYEFNRGQFRLDSLLTIAKSGGSKGLCVVCADITFDKALSENYPIITGFN